ncbi:MANSC domain-containing protein 4-like [Takifugu flavidus]|uniref:MANSC domain-containing protein 4 n=1 Tax=Takifugu flavidus TaxID=433684 RepID=A0A5C6PAL2_9TELE|nr:MANSC domain-containing protein 4-like [Takifugu flavidus]TWW75821.1 MANSC domain-containing protein 4 [Takifugu flavidus]
MNATWGFLTVLSLLCRTEARCSPTSYYKNCWIRRFPGIFIDVEESQRRGAQLLQHYQEESALKCSRTCCLTRNFSCNLAIFHYDTSQDNVNCFHLHCPTLESCILSHRVNVVLYNITKGVDPDLLVFGKYFTPNLRLLPHHYSRVNASEPLPPDKRQFVHVPPPATLPLTSAPTNPDATAASVTTTQLPTSAATPSSSEPPQSPESHAPMTPTTPAPTFSSTAPPSSRAGTTMKHPNASAALSPTAARPSTSLHPPTAPESSERSPNDTEASVGKNHTSGGEGGQDEEDSLGGFGPGWPVAAHTLMVVVAICIVVLLCCCCPFLSLVSWRGQRKRTGRYRTPQGGRRGSMRLIKYVLVRENAKL